MLRPGLIFFLILSFFLLNITQLTAANYTWTGGSSTSWSDKHNWTPASGPPSVGDDVIIPLTSPNLPVVDASAVTIATLTFTGSTTLTLNFPLTVTNAVIVNGANITPIINGPAAFTGASLTISSASTTTFNTKFTISGIVAVNATSTLKGNTLGNTIGGGLTINGNAYAFTLGGNGQTSVSGASSIAYQSSLTIASGNTIYFNTGSTITNTASQNSITNNGTLILLSGCTLSLGDYTSLVNTGSITSYASTFNIPGGATPTTAIKNTGTFRDHISTFNFSGYNSNFQNTGSTANFYGSKSTFNFTNPGVINNSNVFSLDSASVVSLGTVSTAVSNAVITNSGIFNCGFSNSVCIININGQSSGITNTGSPSQKAYFNVGSTSILKLLGGYQANVTNTANAYSIFTLLSDANGSASIDQIGVSSYGNGNTGFVGTFNVQRFITGGSVQTNRGYRLFSSPVTTTGQYTGAATTSTQANTNAISLDNLNKTFQIYTTNYSTPTAYPGAFTAGSNGSTNGFSIANNNPTIYFYKESVANSNASFTSGKNLGVTKITSTSVTLSDGTTPTIPVGNGYLLYFVGPNTRTDGSSATTPADAVITNTGYINQGSLTVNLFYTPYNGASLYSPASSGQGILSYNSGLTTAQGKGFNMVGNPYACTINLQTLLGHNVGISGAYLLARATSSSLAQAYITYTASGTSAPNLGYVTSGEGFIVQASGSGKTLQFLESDKASATQITGSNSLMSLPATKSLALEASKQTISSLQQDPSSSPLTGFYMKIARDSAIYQYCGVYFRSDWSNKAETLDALDLNSTSLPVYLSSLSDDGLRMSVNHMADFKKGNRIKLYAAAKSSGYYKLKIEDIRNIDPIFDIYLIDHYTKDSLDIRQYETYNFNINVADSTTYGPNRFELVIRHKPLPAYTLNAFTGQKVTGNIKLTWNTSDEGNYTGFVLEKLDNATGQFNQLYSTQGDGSGNYSYTDTEPTSLGANTYRLKQTNIDDQITYSDNVNINFDITGMIYKNVSVYPNPARASIQVNIENGNPSAASANYSTIIYSASGVAVSRKSESGSTWTQDVSNWGPGSYIIQIKDSKGKVTGQAKFTKVQ